ncbi:MAG: peroxide stress protein YaaA [Alphaproteobacteria bacterium]
MLALLSPAKSLNYDPVSADLTATQPLLKDQTAVLSKTTSKLTRPKIKALMGISDKLVELNHDRFKAFDADHYGPENAKQAVLAFNGDVYTGLEANSLAAEDLDHAQGVIRILSGFYGLLRPMDLMQPYRLEMGIKLKNPRGDTLYDFWRETIAPQLVSDLEESVGDKIILNLASNEYAKSVDRKAIDAPIIDVAFKDEKDGKLRTLGFFAKKARGQMARHIIENRITNLDGVKQFDGGGYTYQPDLSKDTLLTFTRPQPPKKG